jgi:hypothetical protein
VRSRHLASQRQAARSEIMSREACHAAWEEAPAARASRSPKSWKVRSEQSGMTSCQ